MLPSWLNASFALDTAVKAIVWLWPLLIFVLRRSEGCLVMPKKMFRAPFPLLPSLVGLCLAVAFLHTARIFLVGLDVHGVFQLSWIFTSLAAAVIEELAFRGYLFNVQATRFGVVKAAIANGLLFALYHFPEFLIGQNLVALFGLRFWVIAVMGTVFSLAFAKWKQLGMVMLIHFVWNMLCFWFALA